MRVFKTMFAALLAALMLVSLPGCKKEKEFVVPSNMTRELCSRRLQMFVPRTIIIQKSNI